MRDWLSIQGGVVEVSPRLNPVGVPERGPWRSKGDGNANNEGLICDDHKVHAPPRVLVAAKEGTPVKEAAEEIQVTPQVGLSSAAKLDDAEVLVELWDNFILERVELKDEMRVEYKKKLGWLRE